MRNPRGVVIGVVTLAVCAVIPPSLAQAASSHPQQAAAVAPAVLDTQGTYLPVASKRILDTRAGVGAPKAALGPGGVIHLQVAGIAGVPAANVAAVVLNVTVTGGTAAGYLTVYPDGVTRPVASSINFAPGWTGANSVTVAMGTNGKVAIFNAAGSVQVVADVLGYYLGAGQPALGGQLQPVMPTRLLDTRSDWGAPLLAGFYAVVPMDFGAAVNSHIKALAVTVTAVRPKAAGYLTAWDGIEADLPGTSTLNYTANAIVPNMAIVPVAPCAVCTGAAAGLPSIGVYTQATSDLLVDVVGFYDDATLANGMRFAPMTATRIVDTRTGVGAPNALGPNATVAITTPVAVIGSGAQVLAVNLTGMSPTAATFLTMWPTGAARPGVSNLTPALGQTVANAAFTLLSATGQFSIFNSAGTIGVLVDVAGTFHLYPGTAGPATAPRATPHSAVPRQLG